MKPLFIPLKNEHFEAFQRNNKRAEYRVYGPRWNERVCAIGRRVIISKGYGKQHRISGWVVGFQRTAPQDLSPDMAHSLAKIFGPIHRDIAVIGILLDGPGGRNV